MEGDTTNDSAAAGVYSAGYDANSYADYYYEQQQPSQEGQNYNSYDLPAYEEDESYDCQQQGASRDDGAYAYPYNYEAGIYDLENYETAAEGQNYDYTYIYYPATEGYDASAQQELYAEIPESWSYSPSAEVYLDQVAAEQTASYYYDEEGNLVDGNGGEESPTNVFSQEAYWEADQINDSYGADASTPEVILESFEGTSDADDRGLTDSPLENNAREKHDKFVKKPKTTGKEARTAALSRKKSRKDRIEQRQALLEEEEEKRLMEQLDAADGAKLTAQTRRTKTSTFVGREKAKFQLKIRIAKAVRRNRMPVQIRILTAMRKHLSPMENYFSSSSVECVLSDIFWAAMKGDLRRVRHLVEIEGESATDSKLDPWNLHQTPLHWAAKGGFVPIVSYLLKAGASPRCLDENGSLPLHLSCWAGHIDTSLMLLRSSDANDLYIQDYDAAMCPLDWANVRGHTKLLKAIEKYQDSQWLPKFADDLIRGIIRYKIKVFKHPPKKLAKTGAMPQSAAAEDAPAQPDTSPANLAVEGSAEASPKL